jgi:hypothetical protein
MKLLQKRKYELFNKKTHIINEIKRKQYILNNPIKRVTGCQACYLRKYAPL